MSPALFIVLLCSLTQVEVNRTASSDAALLREMLLDTQHPRVQAQAALLLVQAKSSDAEQIIRQGLLQTDKTELFLAIAAAIRTQHDLRFNEELLAALTAGTDLIRQAAAQSLAELADDRIILRLQALAEDTQIDKTVRATAIWTLGQSGRKPAVIVLLDQLSAQEEPLRQAAAQALAELTGRPYGLQLARWRAWWERHKDISNEQWLEERLAFQTSRARRLESDGERTRAQLVTLHQQLFARLPAADRIGLIQQAAVSEEPTIRNLAVVWAGDIWTTLDVANQKTLSDILYRLSHDGTMEVQRAAVLALGRVPEARICDRLRQLLIKGPTSVRAAAARMLSQQARLTGADSLIRQRQAVVALQKALEDPALEVVIEAAESLGTLGLPEAGPVLAVLLKHTSPTVRQTAALALERVAEANVLDFILDALDDSAVTVRFSLVGALGHAVGDGRGLSEPRRIQLLERLEGILVRDADPGVRSRAAGVLGECGVSTSLPTLWRRLLGSEEARVQEKVWLAMIEIIVRSNRYELAQEWDRLLVEAKQSSRRLQLLTELAARWQKHEALKTAYPSILESLVQTHLEQSKWSAAFPIVRDLLSRPCSEVELERRLRLLLAVGELAIKEGNRAETLRIVQEAQPHVARKASFAEFFEKLDKQARQP